MYRTEAQANRDKKAFELTRTMLQQQCTEQEAVEYLEGVERGKQAVEAYKREQAIKDSIEIAEIMKQFQCEEEEARERLWVRRVCLSYKKTEGGAVQ